MNLSQSSQTLEFFRRFGVAWEFSVTHRVTRSLLHFWDRLVSGSGFLVWITGTDAKKTITVKPSVFGSSIQKCWTSLLVWVNNTFITNKTLGQSSALGILHLIGEFFNMNLLRAIGWLGCAFFPSYGILRLIVTGHGPSSVTLIVIIVGFVFSFLLLLTHVRLDELISSSRLLKVLDDLDE